MNHADVSRWLASYVGAWRSNDRAQIEALFTPDTVYRFAPYDPPVVGADAIAADWLENPDDPTSWQAEYHPVAVDGDTAVAVGWSSYQATADRPARRYANCFVLRFDATGRCSEFTEYFMLAPA